MRSKLTGPEEQCSPGPYSVARLTPRALVLMIESFEDFLDDRNARKKCEQPIGFLFQLLCIGRSEMRMT